MRSHSLNGKRKNLLATRSQNGGPPSAFCQPRSPTITVSEKRSESVPISI